MFYSPVQPAELSESRTEALELSKADFEQYSEICFRLYPLSDRMVALMMSCLRYAEWDARWVERDIDTGLVSDTERVLMSLCLDDLVKTNMLLIGALTGQLVDLDTPLEDQLTGQWDFRTTGLANRLGPEKPEYDPITTNAILDRIRTLIEESDEADYTEVLQSIALILGVV
jgi:hypothetical protein